MKCIVIGSGFAGAVVAERLANKGHVVELIEKRNHIAGNCYDYYNEHDVLVHKYGPHVFNTDNDQVWHYISKFGKWYYYNCFTEVEIDGVNVPFPFNLNSIETFFRDKTDVIEKKLISRYGYGSQTPILELMECGDADIGEFADFLYSKNFLPYTLKQWGMAPTEIDKSVTGRVPVRIDRDDSLTRKAHRYMPVGGFRSLFSQMLNNCNIEITLDCDALNYIKFDYDKNKILWKGEPADFPIVYTGAIDELFDYKYGELPYRSLDFKEYTCTYPGLPCAAVYYPGNQYEYTRATEYRRIMETKPEPSRSTIIYEIPKQFCREKGDIPFYPYVTKEALEIYSKYLNLLSRFNNIYTVGRLAQYKYMNMDSVILSALDTVEKILF